MLAIIIPFFKLTYFEDALQSLSNQTDKRFKVYIGNDGSAENPNQLLEKFKGKFDYKYYYFEKNLGGKSLAQQWERCIDLCHDEEWIMILGDDDVLGETVVASFYSNFGLFEHKTNVIRFATKKIFGRQIQDDVFMHPVWETATDAFYRKFSKTTRSSLSEYIFSKKIYEKFRFHKYPLAWNSDDKAWLDFSDGKPLYSINESVVYFRLSDSNISGQNHNQELKNKSEIEFYKFIIVHKLNFYNTEQRLRLLRRYQAEMRRFRSLTIYEFFILLFYYLKYSNRNWTVKFLKKVYQKILK